MLKDLIEYIKRIRSELIKRGYPEILVEEITQIAIENWVDTSTPSLNKKQILKAMSTSVAKTKINLN
tara:strand:- start:1671 stop:1871 length:201 start_codon:yes stop_codon:yes gene_type:complete